MAESTTDLLQGTLDLLILRVLTGGTEHGWGIAQRIQLATYDVLQVQQGSLYPALRRLETRRLISARWGVSDNNRRARFYELTTRGRGHLEQEISNWQRFAAAVNLVLAS